MILFTIKFVHTLIFFVLAACMGYILYCGLTGTQNALLAAAVAAILLEVAVYALNGLRCPLTNLALRYGDETGDDFIADIFLPKWLADNLVKLCTLPFVFGIVLVVWNFFRL